MFKNILTFLALAMIWCTAQAQAQSIDALRQSLARNTSNHPTQKSGFSVYSERKETEDLKPTRGKDGRVAFPIDRQQGVKSGIRWSFK